MGDGGRWVKDGLVGEATGVEVWEWRGGGGCQGAGVRGVEGGVERGKEKGTEGGGEEGEWPRHGGRVRLFRQGVSAGNEGACGIRYEELIGATFVPRRCRLPDAQNIQPHNYSRLRHAPTSLIFL